MIPPRIVSFGSSSVYGWGDLEGGGFTGRLRHWHEPRQKGNVVYNLGVNGDTITGMLSRFTAEVAYRRPNVILLYTGLNDIRRTGSRQVPMMTSAEKFDEATRTLLTLSQKLAPTLFISPFPLDESQTAPFGRSQTYYLASDAQLFTEVSRHACEELNISYLPNFESGLRPELSFDGIHGTPEAHEILFNKIRDRLELMFT